MKTLLIIVIVLALLVGTALALDCQTYCCFWDITTDPYTCLRWCTKCK